MRNQKKLLWSITVFLAIAITNLFARKGLTFSYAEQISYNKLYYPDEALRITEFKVGDGDSLHIFFKGKDITQKNLFEIYADNHLFLRKTAAHLVIKPPPDRSAFFIRVNSRLDSQELNLGYTPPERYRQAGNSSTLAYEVTSPLIPVVDYPLYKVADWQVGDNNADDIPERSRLDSYLADSMGVKITDSTATKVLKIASYILRITRGEEGTPSDSLLRLDPLSQLSVIRNGNGKIWCGNYTAIFSHFATAAGIAVRLVDCGSVRGSVSSGIHVFNEVYLPENGSWAYTDLLSKNIFVKNRDRFLNTIDLQRMLRYSILDSGVLSSNFNGETVTEVPFSKVAAIETYYFTPGNSFRFFYGDFLKRMTPGNLQERFFKFFYTRPYYAVYSDGGDGIKGEFYFRLCTNYLMMAALAAVLLVLINIFWPFRPEKKTA